MSKYIPADPFWPVFQMPTPEELKRLAELIGPPVPGVIMSIPWYLYPTWMAMYNRVPCGASPLGNVYIKRGEQ